MRSPLLVIGAVALLAPTTAAAAPPADVVVVWAPDLDRAPLGPIARDLGLAVIDRTPSSPAPPAIAPAIRAGIDAYDGLRFEDAWTALERARDLADRSGAADATAVELSDLFLYRALVQAQRDPEAAWDELVAAIVVDPTRVLDRARFPPKIIEEAERARAQVVAGARVTIAVDAPAGCTIRLDGRPAELLLPQLVGPHWLALRCPDHAAWGARIAVTDPMPPIHPTPVVVAPPPDAELVASARSAGARGLFVVEVRGAVATVRLLDLDGRERGRRTVAVARDLAAVGPAMRSLVAPEAGAHAPWYRARWVWAVGGAALAAAIAIPLTATLVHDPGTNGGALQWSGKLPQ